jgi:hypothetical protein
MKTPDCISKVVAFILLAPFWFICGVLLSPFWLFIAIIGALLGEFDWEETPQLFWNLVMIKWFLES